MAGSSDCIMSFNRWQKLMAVRMPKTVVSTRRSGAVVPSNTEDKEESPSQGIPAERYRLSRGSDQHIASGRDTGAPLCHRISG